MQRALLQDQSEELSEIARVCRSCGAYLPVRDRRSHQIDTLFGRVTVEVPRVCVCQCRFTGYSGFEASRIADVPRARGVAGYRRSEF